MEKKSNPLVVVIFTTILSVLQTSSSRLPETLEEKMG